MNQEISQKRHVIVAGFGPVGRVATEQLERHGFRVTIVDLNAATTKATPLGTRTIVQGDVRDERVLRSAGIEHADALILAVPNEDQALEACRVARRIAPQLYIVARTNFLSKGMLARQAGADEVIVEEVVTAEAMGRAVEDRFKVPDSPNPGSPHFSAG